MTTVGPPLTAREHEALLRLAQGHTIPAIAATMHITTGSVQNLLQGVRAKIGVESSLQAVVWAWARGLVVTAPALEQPAGPP